MLHDAWGRPLQVRGTNTDDTEVYEQANRAGQLNTELEAALALGHIGLWQQALGSDRLMLDRRGRAIIGLPYDEQGVPVAEARARIHPDTGRRPRPRWGPRCAAASPATWSCATPSPAAAENTCCCAGRCSATPTAHRWASWTCCWTRPSVSNRTPGPGNQRIGLWSTEHDSPLAHGNRRTYTLFGRDPQAGPLRLDGGIARCVHLDDRLRVHETVRGWWSTGRSVAQVPIEVGFRIRRPSDGVLRWLVVRSALAHGSGGGEGSPGRAPKGWLSTSPSGSRCCASCARPSNA